MKHTRNLSWNPLRILWSDYVVMWVAFIIGLILESIVLRNIILINEEEWEYLVGLLN